MDELKKEVFEIMTNGNVNYDDEHCMIQGFYENGHMRCHLEFMVHDQDSGRHFSVVTSDGRLDKHARVTEMVWRNGRFEPL